MLLPVLVTLTDNETRARYVTDLSHRTLCAAFSLDPFRTTIDLPAVHRPGHVYEGVIFFSGNPIGRIAVMSPDEQFRDLDPVADFWATQTTPRSRGH